MDEIDLVLTREFQMDGSLRLTLRYNNGWKVIAPDWECQTWLGAHLVHKEYDLIQVLDRAVHVFPRLNKALENG